MDDVTHYTLHFTLYTLKPHPQPDQSASTLPLHRVFHNLLRDYKIYYRKTIGHVFTKPVQIEGTTQKIFPSKLFFIVVHICVARPCECT
jgi:hypothetical protein